MTTTITKGYVKNNIDRLTADFIKSEHVSSGKLTVGRVLASRKTYLIAYVPSLAKSEAEYDAEDQGPNLRGLDAPKWERNFYAMEEVGGSGYIEPVKKPTKYRAEITANYISSGKTSIDLEFAILIRTSGGTTVYDSGTVTCTNANGLQTLTIEVENAEFVQPSVMLLVEDKSSAVTDNTSIEVHYTIDSYVDYTIPA